jgi:hypothetical protein
MPRVATVFFSVGFRNRLLSTKGAVKSGMNATVVTRARNRVFLLLVLWCAGCATQRIEWPGRIGQYTFDQAVQEFGPPDKQAKLTDGSVVAEWLTQRGYPQTYFMAGYGCPGWGYGAGYSGVMNTYAPNYYLRLSFDPAGRLAAWKKFAK